MHLEANHSTAPVSSRLFRFRTVSVGLFLLAVLGGLGWSGWSAVEAAREASRRSSCTCHLKQIGLGLQNYADVYKSFPAAYALRGDQPGTSWRVQLLPYIEQKATYDRYRHDEPWDSVFNRRLADEFVAERSIYRCPSAPAAQPAPLTNYVMPVGVGTISDGPGASRFKDFRDGSSLTIAVAEISPTDIYWNEPRDLPLDRMSFQVNDPAKPSISSPHSSGAIVVFADGHTQTLSNDINPQVLKALITIHGGETINQEF